MTSIDHACGREREEPASEVKKVVERYLAALNRGDPDAAAAEVSEDFVNEHTSSLGVNVHGAGAYRARLEGFLDEFAGLRYETEEVIAEGPRVVVPYRMSASWRSPEGDRRPFSIRGVFIFTVRSGQICHRIDYWDGTAFARQVGFASTGQSNSGRS